MRIEIEPGKGKAQSLPPRGALMHRKRACACCSTDDSVEPLCVGMSSPRWQRSTLLVRVPPYRPVRDEAAKEHEVHDQIAEAGYADNGGMERFIR